MLLVENELVLQFILKSKERVSKTLLSPGSQGRIFIRQAAQHNRPVTKREGERAAGSQQRCDGLTQQRDSQFVINSNRHNNSLEIFCAASHIFSVKPQYRSFLMLQSIISTIRFFQCVFFFNFTQSVRRVRTRFQQCSVFQYNNIDLSYVKYCKDFFQYHRVLFNDYNWYGYLLSRLI